MDNKAKKRAVLARRHELAAYGGLKKLAAEFEVAERTIRRWASKPVEPATPVEPVEPPAAFKLIEPVTLVVPITVSEPPASVPVTPSSPYRELPETMKPLRPPTPEEFDAMLLAIGPAPKDKADT